MTAQTPPTEAAAATQDRAGESSSAGGEPPKGPRILVLAWVLGFVLIVWLVAWDLWPFLSAPAKMREVIAICKVGKPWHQAEVELKSRGFYSHVGGRVAARSSPEPTFDNLAEAYFIAPGAGGGSHILNTMGAVWRRIHVQSWHRVIKQLPETAAAFELDSDGKILRRLP